MSSGSVLTDALMGFSGSTVAKSLVKRQFHTKFDSLIESASSTIWSHKHV